MPNTPYSNLNDTTEVYLASMLPLTGERKPTITMSFTGSDPQYTEKILNIKWGLAGNWKVIDLVQIYKDDKRVFEEFCTILRVALNEDHFEFRRVGQGLFNLPYLFGNRKIEVEGRDFDTGIANLFTELTVFQTVQIEDFEQPVPIPRLIIECEGENIGGFYKIFCWVQSLKCFKNIRYFKDTPDYLRPFREKTENTNPVLGIAE